MVRNSSNHFIQYEKFSQGKTGKQWSWNFGWDGNGFSFSKAPKAYHVFHPRLLSKIHANNEKLSEKDRFCQLQFSHTEKHIKLLCGLFRNMRAGHSRESMTRTKHCQRNYHFPQLGIRKLYMLLTTNKGLCEIKSHRHCPSTIHSYC